MHPICLPTLEGGLVVGLLATEAVTPMVYSRRLTNKLGGCLVTLCSWGAHLSSVHTPVSSNLPIIVVSFAPSDGFAPLHNVCWRAGVLRPRWRTTSYYWTKQARCAMVTLTLCCRRAFACHHWFGQTETETLVMTRISWGAQVAQT